MKIIFDYNRTLFNPDTGSVFPGVFRVLKTLSQKHSLFLVTLNKPERKNSQAITTLEPYFEQVLFVEKKTESVFKEVSGGDTGVVVVGDRFEDEIRIGMQLGFITIHLPTEKPTYSKKNRPHFTGKSITEVLTIIDGLEK